jgi:O-antigen ligase
MGFAGHQNTLAAAILFTLPGVIYLVNSDQRIVISNKNNSFPFLTPHFLRLSSFVLLLTSNFLILIITYSRAAWLALFIGLITFIILTKNIKIILSLILLLITLLILTFSIPSVSKFLESIMQKADSPLWSRREILWEPSYEAAKLGGLIGLGYGVNAPGIKTPALTGSYYKDGRYIREKGNSTLALIEETGLIGLILFIFPLLMIIKKFKIQNSKFKNNYTPAMPYARSDCAKARRGSRGRFYITYSSLAAMLLHSQFEAWWVGVGSIQLPLFLIYLFLAIIYKN